MFFFLTHRRVVLSVSVVDAMLVARTQGGNMTCIFCDVPRERHTPTQLAECQDMGAQQGWLGLALT